MDASAGVHSSTIGLADNIWQYITKCEFPTDFEAIFKKYPHNARQGGSYYNAILVKYGNQIYGSLLELQWKLPRANS